MDLVIVGAITIHSTLKTSLKTGVITPISEYTERFSGSTLHTAINASILKADVGIVSPVGRDAVGLMDILRRYSVDYSHVVLSSKKSANLMDVYTSSRHYTLYYKGATEDLRPDTIKGEYLKKAKAVHVCFPDPALTEHVVNVARKEHVLTSVDTAFSHADADIVFCEPGNPSTEQKNPPSHTQNVVLDFDHGIMVNGKKIPVFKDDTFYEQGVKDAFIAAFLVRYVKSEHAENAALYGSCAAYLFSKTEQKVLTYTKKDVDALFAQKLKEMNNY